MLVYEFVPNGSLKEPHSGTFKIFLPFAYPILIVILIFILRPIDESLPLFHMQGDQESGWTGGEDSHICMSLRIIPSSIGISNQTTFCWMNA